jgi:hypothetical protein
MPSAFFLNSCDYPISGPLLKSYASGLILTVINKVMELIYYVKN